MANILNLDAVKPERTIILRAVEWKVRSMTVRQFIEETDWEVKFKESSPVQQVQILVDQIAKQIPECPKEYLLDLDLEQLRMLMNFIRGDDLKEAAAEKRPQ